MLYVSMLILFLLNTNKYRPLTIGIIVLIFTHTLMYFNPYRYIGLSTSRTVPYSTPIPEEYTKVSTLLNNNSSEGAVFFSPGINSGYFSIDDAHFLSQDILGKLISRPIIYSDDTTMRLSKSVINEIPANFNPQIVGKASVRYIVIRKDFDPVVYIDQFAKKVNTSLLANEKFYKHIYSSSHLEVFELTDMYYKNIISVQTNITPTNFKYKKVSSVKYTIETTARALHNNKIIFRNSYHDDWQLQGLDSNEYTIKHNVFDGFANAWSITKKEEASNNLDKPIFLTIYYKSQNWSYFFVLLSGISLLLTVLYIVKLKTQQKTK